MPDGRSRRSSKIDVVIGKGSKGDDLLAKHPNKLKGAIHNRTQNLFLRQDNLAHHLQILLEL